MTEDTALSPERDIRIQLALDNWETYVLQLASLSDDELSKKLDIINLQAVIAQEKNMSSSIELLDIWWRQVVEARVYKEEHNIPDAPDEIELAIADIETTVAQTEQRQEILEDDLISQRTSKPKIKEDLSDQMSLF